jgi:hypothetical protein
LRRRWARRNGCVESSFAATSVLLTPFCVPQAWQQREAELLSRMAELQGSLNHSAAASAAHEAALCERGAAAAAASPAAGGRGEPAPVEESDARAVRPGELSELRRQLQVLQASRKHDASMLLDAEERVQALANSASARAAPRTRTLAFER